MIVAKRRTVMWYCEECVRAHRMVLRRCRRCKAMTEQPMSDSVFVSCPNASCLCGRCQGAQLQAQMAKSCLAKVAAIAEDLTAIGIRTGEEKRNG